jgi:catechol 2,3-dioxygenase-like lactoylglutathione lyase family enzyme
MAIESISAVTLATRNMGRALAFYASLGFEQSHGGAEAAFTSLRAGAQFLNLVLEPGAPEASAWGRIIFHVSDVDALHRRALGAGLQPHATPRDAEWGERYFHITDPDGHELSFARLLAGWER